MKYGTRNVLQATVKTVKTGDIMSQLECTITAPAEIQSVLTTDSVKELNLKEGDKIVLLVKAVHVIPAKE